MDNIKLQVRFSIEEDGYPPFQDALYFTQEEFDALTEEEIEAMKQARFENFKALINNPPPEPTKEQLESDLEEKEREVAELKKKINDKE